MSTGPATSTAPCGPLGLRERKKAQARRDIRDTAFRLFLDLGYDAVSVDDIARDANVSRTTFFNYFSTKEAVVTDPHPGEREGWLGLLASRPVDEPIWESVSGILLAYAEQIADRITMIKKLQLGSPTLAAAAAGYSYSEFHADIKDWVGERTPQGGELESALMLNVALAAAETAYSLWTPTVPFAVFLDTAFSCLTRVGEGLAHT